MNRFSVISVSDPAWTEIISLSNRYDFYHTQSYSLLESNNEPLLCVAYENSDFIAMPIVIRRIEGTDFFDATSVYGYCGPVSSLPFKDLSRDHIIFFQSELLKFFESRKLVSVFMRLHPFLNQTIILNNFGIIKEINETVAIDLRLPENIQLKGYRESHSRKIRKLRREDYSVTSASSEAEIDAFIQIYNDSMARLNADSSLVFPREYFYKFLFNPSFKSRLLIAKKGKEITAGAIFTMTNKIMQYHLSGFKEEFGKDAPMKLLIDEARKIGIENNMDFLHLGGGFSGHSDDSLFYFKAGFSDLRFKFSVWQLIVDEPVYNSLIEDFKIDTDKSDNYFPAYRTKSGKYIKGLFLEQYQPIMKDIAIYGIGGYGGEIACLLNQINEIEPRWNLIGFIDDGVPVGTSIRYGTVLGNIDYLNAYSSPLSVIIAIATPRHLKIISEKINNPMIDFPNIIAPNVNIFDKAAFTIGHGNLISFGCRISYNVNLGNFNLLNGAVSVGHNVKMGDCNVLQPSVRVLGDCSVGNNNFFGVQSIVLQGVKVGNDTRIGVLSVVIRHTKDNSLYFGNPAKKMKF